MWMVLRNLTSPPHEPMKLSLGRFLKFEVCFLLAVTSVKRAIELRSLFFGLKRLRGWTFYFSIALKFIFKTQNPSVMDLRCEEFLSCPWGTLLIRIGKSCCSSQSKQWGSIWARHSNTGSVKKVSRSTIAFWLRVVIIEAYRVASDGDYTVVRLSHTRSTILIPLCCSGNTFQLASNEGWNVSITDHINQIILNYT